MGTWAKYADWYEQNKGALSDRRKARYDTDPVYRQQIIDRARTRRESVVKQNPDGIDATDLAEHLGVSPWTLNRWKNEGYIPVTSFRGAYFKQSQVELMGLLVTFFKMYPKRSASMHKPELDVIVQVIQHNWN